jgi:hypothetical protein
VDISFNLISRDWFNSESLFWVRVFLCQSDCSVPAVAYFFSNCINSMYILWWDPLINLILLMNLLPALFLNQLKLRYIHVLITSSMRWAYHWTANRRIRGTARNLNWLIRWSLTWSWFLMGFINSKKLRAIIINWLIMITSTLRISLSRNHFSNRWGIMIILKCCPVDSFWTTAPCTSHLQISI